MSKRRKSIICPYCKTAFEPSSLYKIHCSVECRFWSKVNKGELNECWNWLASTRWDYGTFKYKNSMTNAHRVAWMLTHGPIPKTLCTLHHCDNPLCVNPAHLFLGTKADNAIDMVQKGRQCYQKLTKQQVKAIKIELAEGILHRIIAKKYGVIRQTITYINAGRTWSHVTI